VLADTSGRSAPYQDLSHDAAVSAALHGKPTGGKLVHPGAIYLVATAPIRVGGQDLGTVTVGRRIIDEMATQLYHDTGSEVTFFAGNAVAATSWSGPMRQQLKSIEPQLPRVQLNHLPIGYARRFPLTMGGQRLMCQVVALQGDDGTTGFLLIQSSLDAALRPYVNIQRALTFVGFLGLLVAALGSMIVAGGVTQPLRRIARAAQGLMQGDWSQRAPVTSQDEVGLLAETFNRMAERLERWDSDMRAAVAERTRELDAAVARLDTAFRQMRQFNADASHELRTPLTVIRGEAEVALRSARSPEEYQAVLLSIQEETERMSRIIEQLLLLARADSGELILERHPVVLDDLVRDVAHRAKVLALDRGVRLRVASLEHMLIEGDEDRLRQLALNLIDNALKYTSEGGEAVVRLSTEDGSPGLANRNATGQNAGHHPPAGLQHRIAVLEVEDTGIGIAAADLPRLFDRFYRVDKSRSRAHGSSGLGLAICRWIVEAHGGRIDVSSRQGVGSTFTVRLPGATALDGMQAEAELEATGGD
jgi:signal transduction histidine kinase